MKTSMIIKIISIPVLFILSIAFGLLPVYNRTVRNSTKWRGICNAFAGGIFLALGLIHLLPEGNEAFNEGCGGEWDYRYAFLIALVGYILILFIEKVAFDNHNIVEANDNSEQLLRNSTYRSIQAEEDEIDSDDEKSVSSFLMSR